MKESNLDLFFMFEEFSVTLSIISANHPPKSTTTRSSLSGITLQPLNKGTANFLNEIDVFAYPESLLTIQATVLINPKNLANLVNS